MMLKIFLTLRNIYHKMISSSWGIGGIIIPVVLLMSFFNYYYEQGFSSPVKLSFDV
ncbi:hypothetical protein P3S67_024053 [Capsicum chacoense]